MQFDDIKEGTALPDDSFKDAFIKDDMEHVNEKACSSSSIEVQGTLRKGLISKLMKQFIRKINISLI